MSTTPKNATIEYSNIRYILTDIEGTTSDIAFVKNVLFPYSAREMRNFISTHRHQPAVQSALKDTGAANENAAITQLLEWIEKDVKHPALKTLQGLIWKKGYETGAYRAHMYSDVEPALKSWKQSGLKLGVYSSGSIAAQKLFFKHSVNGDLLDLFSDHFDLEVGSKKDVKSYSLIFKRLKEQGAVQSPEQILFLSDVPEELDAAKECGFQTAQLVRPGTQPSARHPVTPDFSSIKLV